jgi:CHASE2 domain-containing sensor protein
VILTLVPVSLSMVLAALIAGALAWRTRWMKLVVILIGVALIVGGLVFACVCFLAAGFSQMR